MTDSQPEPDAAEVAADEICSQFAVMHHCKARVANMIREAYAEQDRELMRLRVEVVQLAKLGASTPQFYNVLEATNAMNICDRVLGELAAAKSFTTQSKN